MTRSQATILIALLAAVLAVVVHAAYLHKPTSPRYEYKLIVGDKIELGQLQTAGDDGFDCFAPVAIAGDGGKAAGYVIVCKRPR